MTSGQINTKFTVLFHIKTRVYRKLANKREYVNNYYIERNEKGLFVRILSTLDKQIHLQKELRLDHNYAARIHKQERGLVHG
jgi:hypothetical protein